MALLVSTLRYRAVPAETCLLGYKMQMFPSANEGPHVVQAR